MKLNSGSLQTTTGTTSWSIPLTLTLGANTILARATDTSNNIKETSINITYTPPNTAPSAPQTLTSIAGNNSVSLTWLAPSSNGGSVITGYKVYRGTTSGGETLLATGGCSSLGNVLTCVDATVANGTAYYYQATAINAIGESIKSNETIANPQATRIQGTVSNSAPISGATVTDGTRTVATDASGDYTINTAAGTYTLTASKSGYVSSSKSVTISASQTATVNFTLTQTDAIPPNISGGSPSGTLSYNTTQANLTLATDENATCKYSTSAGAAYSSMPNNFAATGTAAHSQAITNLTSGQSYSYYIRCKDGQNNANAQDYKISFSIASAPSGSGGGGSGGGGSTPSDTTPPAKVTELASAPAETEIFISWNNPKDGDYNKTKIQRKENSYPTSHTDGNTVFNDNKNSFTDKNLASGTDYYYSIFTYDSNNNYSAGSQFKITTKGEKPSGSAPAYPDGALIKTSDSFKVYVVINQKKKWIPTPEVFETLGYKWTAIAEITKETLKSILDFEDNLIRPIGDYKVYLVVNGIKRHIPNPEIFLNYGFSWEDVKDVPQITIDKYSRGYLVRESKQGTIYYLRSDGVKKWIPNPEIFSSYNNKWEDVQVISKKEMESYPETNLIQLEGDNRIYLIEGNTKRHIPSAEIFNKYGYDWDKAMKVNEVEFGWFKEGNQVR